MAKVAKNRSGMAYFDTEFKVQGRINFVHLTEPYVYTDADGTSSAPKYQVTLVIEKGSVGYKLLKTLYKNPKLLAELDDHALDATVVRQIKQKLTPQTLRYLEDGDDEVFIEKRGSMFAGCVRHSFKGGIRDGVAQPIPLWVHNGEEWKLVSKDSPQFSDGAQVVLYFRPALHQGFSFFNFIATKIAFIKNGEPFFLEAAATPPADDVSHLLPVQEEDKPETWEVVEDLDVPEDIL